MTCPSSMSNSVYPAWLRKAALWTYYFSTLPWRRLVGFRDMQQGTAPAIVLFYHRVSDQYPNAWTMSNREFQYQVDWLRDHCDLVSLDEAQKRLRNGNHRPCVSITFDDGYGDNCHFAIPYLIKHRIPCTYFVTTSNVLEAVPFPHDIACDFPLRPNTPDEIRAMSESGIEIGVHAMHHVDFGPIADKVQLYQEVIVSRDQLSELLGRQPRYFAFPYGLPNNLNREVFRIARQEGYLGVCSAYGAYNNPGPDPFHLQRIHGDPERCRFLNWLTVDPRKRHHGFRFSEEAMGAPRPALESVPL